MEFMSRQMLDVFSPANFLLTNPEILQRTLRQGGANLVNGFRNLVEDWERAASGKKPVGAERFEVGRDVAVTAGEVVYRSRLIEAADLTRRRHFAEDADSVFPARRARRR